MYIDKDTNVINLRFGGNREYIKGVILNDDTIIQNMQCDLKAKKPTLENLQDFENKNKSTFKIRELKEREKKSHELIYYTQYNYISETQPTHFYLSNVKPYKYGVCVNIKDIAEKDEIIKTMIEERRPQIQAHLKDKLQNRFIKELTQYNTDNNDEYFLLLRYNGNITRWIKDKKREDTKAISKTPSNE